MSVKVTFQMNNHAEDDFVAGEITCGNEELAAVVAAFLSTPLAHYKSNNGVDVFAHQIQVVPA